MAATVDEVEGTAPTTMGTPTPAGPLEDTPQRAPGGTHFASPDRAAAAVIAEQHAALAANPFVTALLDSFPEPAIILNQHRQIVFANDKLATLLDRSKESILGLRPGEAFGCVHAMEEPAGCGTSRSCKYCGAVNAILTSQRSAEPVSNECRILCQPETGVAALDLRVWATPLLVQQSQYTVFAIRDTADEQRRRVLERLFFHDVLNSAGSLRGIVDLLPDMTPVETAEYTAMALQVADDLIEQIRAQRDLAAAERGDLKPQVQPIDASEALHELRSMYLNHPVAQGKDIAEPVIAGPPDVVTDPVLLRRVLGNLLKNALEASAPGDVVTLGYNGQDRPEFRVHNSAVMPEAVRLQLFQRSFTTKGGTGRGVGTYSVKLLTENYLHGQVTFESTPERGTTFIIVLPANGAAA